MNIKEHNDKYDRLNKEWGVSWVHKGEPLWHNKETWILLYREDNALNNVPLTRWDNLALAFRVYNPSCQLELSELVCMQKRAAEVAILYWMEGYW